MVRKQVASLYKLCVQASYEILWKFIKKHCSSCEFCSMYKTDKCSTIVTVKDALNLPVTVLQSVYEKAYDEFQIHHKCSPLYECDVNLLYSLLSLLEIPLASLNISEFCLVAKKDTPFLLSYGKCINTLYFQGYNVNEGILELGKVSRSVSLWKTVLQNTNNIQVLNLQGVRITDDHFAVIGQECWQLKVLQGIDICMREYYRNGDNCLGPNVQSFTKLLCQNNETGIVRNKCCTTLQEIHFTTDLSLEFFAFIHETISFILDNVPNLKTLGNRFGFDAYFKSLNPDSIPETNLECIRLVRLTNDLIPVMRKFAPKAKKLTVCFSELSTMQKLITFHNLEEFCFFQIGEFFISYKIFSMEWSTLRQLTVTGFSASINIDVLSTCLPQLTYLALCHIADEVIWSRKTYFKSLTKVDFRELPSSSISWFASFASTVKYISICSPDEFNGDLCNILLNIPFPNLEYLYINPFSYDFLFYTRLLEELSNLRVCVLFDPQQNAVPVLSQFLKENNLVCALESTPENIYML